MGFALASLMASMFAGTLILYCVALAAFGRKLTKLAKFVGFAVALPSAAVTALVLAPESSVVSAQTMLWQGAAIGAVVGVGVMLAAGARRSNEVRGKGTAP
jgi:hypothetical protein